MDDSEKNNEKMEKTLDLGGFLRSEREKKGLSCEDLVRITRIRDQFIVALENEDWDSLPSPVFVKGFIRSYVKALGLDSSKALALYEKSGPKKEESPHPLSEPRKSKNYLILLLVLIIIGVIILIYLWMNYSRVAELAPETSILVNRENNVIEDKSVPTVRGEIGSMRTADVFIKGENMDALVETIPVEPEESSLHEERGEPDTGIFVSGEAVESNHKEPETSPAGEIIDEESVISEQVPEEVLPPPENDNSSLPLTLTGVVSTRTYVKIYIDDNLPKEYIFQPGSRPQWEAKEGFDIVIGNAAGIMFDLNGQIIQDLGSPGKVIRIRLPKDFESKYYKD